MRIDAIMFLLWLVGFLMGLGVGYLNCWATSKSDPVVTAGREPSGAK
jgi:hypothetical protein